MDPRNGASLRLLTTQEVSERLRIAPRTVCLWAECGILSAVRVGRQWRFPEDAIDTYLKSSKGQLYASGTGLYKSVKGGK